MLKIFNSLTREKAVFKPMTEGQVKLYVCGMTVYDYCHLGHARVLVAFDMIVRYLRASGYEVEYIRNITDIDDKIIHRARETDQSVQQLTNYFINAMHEDIAVLNILPPTAEPRATTHIDQMLKLIQRLLDKEVAYIAANGDIYYSVEKFPQYGQLAHKDIEGLVAGARVDINEVKRNPLDFVLWKLAKEGEPSWDSPWGDGRPGWHIECSAMSMNCLGEHFDMHGGGFDLQFPHHENEIAQSEAATNKPFVNYWLHVGFLQINKEKMSKSLGNFFTIRDVLAQYPAEVVRYFLLASHYRSPLNYSTENLEMATHALDRLYRAIEGLNDVEVIHHSLYEIQFKEAMDDDFNTPQALAVLFELAREVNRLREHDATSAAAHAVLLKKLAGILGLLEQGARRDQQAQQLATDVEVKEIEALIQARNIARQQKQWAEADHIRDQLFEKGIMLEDKAGETTWYFTKPSKI